MQKSTFSVVGAVGVVAVLVASAALDAWDYLTEQVDVMRRDGSYKTTTRLSLRKAA